MEKAFKYSGVAFLVGVLTYVAQMLPALATSGGIPWNHPADLAVAVVAGAGTAGIIKALPWLQIVLKNAPDAPPEPTKPAEPPAGNIPNPSPTAPA